jgi:hypothetical protein
MPCLVAIESPVATPVEIYEIIDQPILEAGFTEPFLERQRVEMAGGPLSSRNPRKTEPPSPRPPWRRSIHRPLSREEQRTWAETSSVYGLVDGLRDDDVKWNATAAAEELYRRMHDPLQFSEVVQELELALLSADGQQRGIATGLMQSLSRIRHPGVAPYVPSERLLDLTADALDYWDCWIGGSWIRGSLNDEKSVAFTIDHLERMEERLARKLVTVPVKQRFIHAYILARERREHLAYLAVPVLVDRLRDNWVRDDALMSMEALYRLGPAAIPWLRNAHAYADHQQQGCIDLLLWEYADPAVTREERARRRHLNRVTWKCDDPVQSWQYWIPTEY